MLLRSQDLQAKALEEQAKKNSDVDSLKSDSRWVAYRS
jgi:hypothetical protein